LIAHRTTDGENELHIRIMARMVLLVFGALLASLAWADRPPSVYLSGKADIGVVLLHGHGGTADGNVVGPLMRMFNTEFGYHTLSLDLPQVTGVSAGPQLATAYAPRYPEVEKLIEQGIDYLVRQKNVKTLYLVGFSAGARMMTAYLAKHPDQTFGGYVGVSTSCGGPQPMDSNDNLRRVTLPVLDIYGTGSPPDLNCAAGRKKLPETMQRYTVVQVAGAPHNFRGYETQLTPLVADWLRALNAVEK
jgi:pimeloyl-ACP methyl ester carboxylesterase